MSDAKPMKITPADVQKLLGNIQNMTESQLRDLYATIEEHEILAEREKARKNFMGFVKKVWPDRKSTRLNSSHSQQSRMPSSA